MKKIFFILIVILLFFDCKSVKEENEGADAKLKDTYHKETMIDGYCALEGMIQNIGSASACNVKITFNLFAMPSDLYGDPLGFRPIHQQDLYLGDDIRIRPNDIVNYKIIFNDKSLNWGSFTTYSNWNDNTISTIVFTFSWNKCDS